MALVRPEEGLLYIYKAGPHPEPEVLLQSPVKC